MKKSILIGFLVLLSTIAFGQTKYKNIYFGLMASADLSTTTITYYPRNTPKLNPNAGISLRIKSIQLELLYGKHSGRSELYSSGYTYRVMTDFNYLQMNYLFIRNINNGKIKFGLSILGMPKGKTEQYTYQIYKESRLIYEDNSHFNDNYFTPDLGIIVGYEQKLTDNLYLNNVLFWTANTVESNILKLSFGLKLIL